MTDQQSMNAAASGQEPLRNFNFHVEIAGVVAGHFTSVSGLGARVHPIRYREGGAAQIVRNLPGPLEYAEVELRHGLTQNRDLWSWMQATVQGRADRRNVSIIMLGMDGSSEALRWNLIGAWPCEWQGTVLDALGREVAIEVLKLAFDQLERE